VTDVAALGTNLERIEAGDHPIDNLLDILQHLIRELLRLLLMGGGVERGNHPRSGLQFLSLQWDHTSHRGFNSGGKSLHKYPHRQHHTGAIHRRHGGLLIMDVARLLRLRQVVRLPPTLIALQNIRL
jgi:hypothetical protein